MTFIPDQYAVNRRGDDPRHELARAAIVTLCARLAEVESQLSALRHTTARCPNCRASDLKPATPFEG